MGRAALKREWPGSITVIASTGAHSRAHCRCVPEGTASMTTDQEDQQD